MKNKPSAKLTDLLAEYWDVPWDEIEAARDAVLLLEEERDALEAELAKVRAEGAENARLREAFERLDAEYRDNGGYSSAYTFNSLRATLRSGEVK